MIFLSFNLSVVSLFFTSWTSAVFFNSLFLHFWGLIKEPRKSRKQKRKQEDAYPAVTILLALNMLQWELIKQCVCVN